MHPIVKAPPAPTPAKKQVALPFNEAATTKTPVTCPPLADRAAISHLPAPTGPGELCRLACFQAWLGPDSCRAGMVVLWTVPFAPPFDAV